MSAARTAIATLGLLVSTMGCAGVLGVEFDDATLDEARLLSREESACSARERSCNGRCVRVDDPAFGCESSASCSPCDLARATARCDLGVCAVLACDAGRADCDGNPANGCEAALSSTSSCGACGVRCEAGFVCSAGGCARTCPAGSTRCGDSCVDLTTDLDNCGVCGSACAPRAGTKRSCQGGACLSECAEGFAHCNGDLATCERQDRFFVDADGDGWGGAEKKACGPAAGLATMQGDCNDLDARVHPGQLALFGAPYPTTAADGTPSTSYDYDCNGVESRDPARAVLPLNLPPFAACSPSGDTVGVSTILSSRSGPGVDRACGVSPELACHWDGSTCTCTPTGVTDPVGCR